MKKMTKQNDKRLSIAKSMPPLRRVSPGEKYSAKDGRVLDWVKFHTDLPLYLIDLLSRIGYIKYNSDTGKRHGIDYQEPCPHGYVDWDECPDCRH